jgi:hypothetical protein
VCSAPVRGTPGLSPSTTTHWDYRGGVQDPPKKVSPRSHLSARGLTGIAAKLRLSLCVCVCDVTISNTSDEPPTKEGPQIISKARSVLLKGGEDITMTILAPTTIVAMNSISPIQIQFKTLCFGVKIKDVENNMVLVAPCQIKIEGRHFVKGDDGYIMTKSRKALLQGDRMMSSWFLKIFQQAIRCNELKIL